MTKTVLITGCSSGLGEHAARALKARGGWRVLATCRKPADVARLSSEGFESFVLDVADEKSRADGVAEALARTDGRLDALFNNAGHGQAGAVEDVPVEALRAIFETNVFGLHDLTRRVLPVMRAQRSGRIVMHSSGLGRNALRWRGAYNASKYALEGLTDTLRLELRGSGVHVSTLNTGPVTSKFRENSLPHFERWIDWENSALADAYRREVVPFFYAPPKRSLFQREPDAVTRRVIHALESPRPRARYLITPATHIAEGLRRILPQRAIDDISARF
ncbi:SDR family NAD(P)-dependent oxidoreductase [Rhodobacterales bacterium HKCCE3408]|nr:SDR family NAD(P)-dependent oxidoreductase [Rhodobacterales bacterium HKCCE3408]